MLPYIFFYYRSCNSVLFTVRQDECIFYISILYLSVLNIAQRIKSMSSFYELIFGCTTCIRHWVYALLTSPFFQNLFFKSMFLMSVTPLAIWLIPSVSIISHLHYKSCNTGINLLLCTFLFMLVCFIDD